MSDLTLSQPGGGRNPFLPRKGNEACTAGNTEGGGGGRGRGRGKRCVALAPWNERG
eukprot:SAG31_NODE_3545_length_4140_cov_1.821579_3_plen_56_part_00